MNIGIVCEFNPFHQGHKYLIDTVKGENDTVICAMSGNFVQRGEFAVYDKFTRARAALQNGADLVLEIPSVCATRSAQGFAEAGVKILESTGICEALAFGAECDDADTLLRLCDEIKAKDAQIREALHSGISYPAARRKIVDSPVLDEPNNILAIEYLRCTSLKPLVVRRIGKGHDSDDAAYSAGEIRKHLEGDFSSLRHCEKAVLYKLRTMSAEDFRQIEDVSEGLENRIVQAVSTAQTLDGLYDAVKSKRYTHSRIRRIILRAFLGITGDTPQELPYLRILGFNAKGKQLLGEMKKCAALPLVSSYADAKALGEKERLAFERESGYTDIYNIGYRTPLPCATEKTTKVITEETL